MKCKIAPAFGKMKINPRGPQQSCFLLRSGGDFGDAPVISVASRRLLLYIFNPPDIHGRVRVESASNYEAIIDDVSILVEPLAKLLCGCFLANTRDGHQHLTPRFCGLPHVRLNTHGAVRIDLIDDVFCKVCVGLADPHTKF